MLRAGWTAARSSCESHAVPAPRRPQAHRRTGRQRACARDEAAAGRHAGQGARARARWQRMLEGGEYATLAEMADAERISRSYVFRVRRLTLLAPDIVVRILDGRPTVGLPQLLKPFPVEWEKQLGRFC